jgi:hypothetical protein
MGRLFFNLSLACTAAAVLTVVVVDVLRHLSYLKHRDSGFVPSTQHMLLWASLIMAPLILAGLVFLVLFVVYRT